MINAGRWILVAVSALYGLSQILAGAAFLTGAVKLPMDETQIPPGQEQLFVWLGGGITLIMGFLLLLAAWGIWSWRSWARFICIILAALIMLSIVVISFQRPLPASIYVVLAVTVAVLAWLFNSEVVAAFRSRGQRA